MFKQEEIVSLLLRLGVAFAFIFPALSAYFDPFSWIGYFPNFLRELFGNDTVLLHLFGIVEIVIAGWILVGKHIFWPSLLAAGMLAAIILFNWNQFPVLFRDVPILLMAFILVIMHYPGKAVEPKT